MSQVVESQSPSEPLLTPAQALCRAVLATGWARNKQDFARLLRINPGNIYGYLADPCPRGVDGAEEGRNKSWIKAQTGLLHGWCWALAQVTALRAKIVLHPDGMLEILVTGRTVSGEAVGGVLPDGGRYKTAYADHDGFRPPKGWEDQWRPSESAAS